MTETTSPFVHLRLHSEYDIQQGSARLSGNDSVVNYAAALQQPALALTDNGCLFGAVKFYNQCRKNGIKPIIGCELMIDTEHSHYLLLLCATQTGYINLNRLLSRFYRNGGLQRDELNRDTTEGIIALSGGERGDIGSAIRYGQLDVAEKSARDWQARFPDRFYIEVWRTGAENNYHIAAADIGERLGLPLAATHPVQCARAEDREALNIKLCIAAGRRIADSQRPQPLTDAPELLTADEMRTRFADIPAALDNSADIALRCNFAFTLGKTYLPTLSGELSSAALLQKEAEDGLNKKLPTTLTAEQRQEYDSRLQYEIGVINEMEYADYFLIVMDFIRWAKENDIPVGPGRGSGAGSLVSYALDITTVDPLQYNLLFERFLNPERVSMPDLDIDFCANGRDRVIRYVEERYGKDHVAQIVTFGTIGAKNAVRDVGRVQGNAYGYCDQLARMIPNAPKITLQQALNESADFADEAKSDEGGELIRLALQVEGLPRNIGTHAGGVLIAPRPLDTFCPQYAAADTNTMVSQYDMDDIKDIGLVKFDFLGLRTLTILAEAEREIRRQVQADFSLETLPLDDEKTYALYSSGHTAGIFQCESGGMRELMKSLKPDRFSDLIALVALYRPGPLNAGMDKAYIERKHGRQDISYPHTELQPSLQETYGLFIYQEQVMEIARLMGGYSLAEADILRQAMGKKDEKKMASMRPRFVEGSGEKLTAGEAQKLFDDMAQFAEYGFNKSHATAYALLSYRTAYIKAHYPAIHIAATINAEADNTTHFQMMTRDMKRLGCTLTPPDINRSEGEFRALDSKTVQFGLKAIKGIGAGVIDALMTARARAPFTDLFDFCSRCGATVPQSALELLIQAGAFDSLHDNRAAALATVPSARVRDNKSGSLFADSDSDTVLADCRAWSLREILLNERTAIGFPLRADYPELYQRILPRLPLTWQRLRDAEAQENAIIAGHFRRISRKAGKKNGVFVLYDSSGEMDVVASRDLMKMLTDSIKPELLIIHGKTYQNFRGAMAIEARSIQKVDDFLAQQLRQVTLVCTNALDTAQLTTAAKANGGRQRLVLQYTDKDVAYQMQLAEAFCLTADGYDTLADIAGVRDITLLF